MINHPRRRGSLRLQTALDMARAIFSSLLCSNGRFALESTRSHGRRFCWAGVNQSRRESGFRVRNVCHWWLPDSGGRSSRENGNVDSLRTRLVHLGAHPVKQYETLNVRCSLNDPSDRESLRYHTTHVTVNFTQHIVKADLSRQLHTPTQTGSLSNIAEEQHEIPDTVIPEAGGYDEDDSAAEEVAIMASVDVNVKDDAQDRVVARPSDERWWHIPDSIDEMLRLPSDFEDRIEALFRSFGSCIDSRELQLRVLVHKSYYDRNMPLDIREQQYLKPHSPLFIYSGEVRQQYVDDGPSKISCMIFGDAHGEVRSQLAILGDAIIGLAVSSVLVRQHSSAGTITERKCQLVSNSNLARVWSCLIGSQSVVLSSGDSSSHATAQLNMMADSCEAYIGALYTEKGFETAYTCVINTLLPLLVQADPVRNPVHALNVHSSTSFQVLPEYRLIGIDNKDTQHQVCRVRVYVKGIRMATGLGMNKKLAKIDAARKALEKWSSVFGRHHDSSPSLPSGGT